MRTLVSLIASTIVAAAVVFTASAGAADSLSLSIKISGSKVLYGHQLTLSGRLSSGAARRPVEIEARPYGGVFARGAVVETGVNGGWTLRVRPTIATTYEARADAVVTPPLSVGVEPLVVTHLLRDGAISAHVEAGRTFVGRTIELQRRLGSRWSAFERTVLDSRSSGVFRAPLSRGSTRVRVAMSVNEAGSGYLAARSDPFVYRARVLSISVSAPSRSVSFGRRVELSGRISTAAARGTVIVSAERFGSSTVKRIAVRTSADGRWTLLVQPSIETRYRASWNGLASHLLVVGVRPLLGISRLADGRLAASAAPAKTFVGRTVDLERRSSGRWETIAQRPLAGPNGRALFPEPAVAGGSVLRVAISVNEAGAGYLGSSSRILSYHRAGAVSLVPSSYKVLYGHALTLSGQISSRRSGERVELLAHPFRSRGASEAATVLTGTDGRWSFRVAPSIETSYGVLWGANASRQVTVGVEPRVSVVVLSDGRIATRVVSGRPFGGRVVQLQELMPVKGWSTIRRMPLDRRASAIFPALSIQRVASLRIAISVNQAGAGLLGATSHAFAYRSGV